MSSMGSLEAIATCSISSIIRLKAALRVAMPLFKKLRASRCSSAKRAASRSYRERSRSMIV
jgi:hypothetical protein